MLDIKLIDLTLLEAYIAVAGLFGTVSLVALSAVVLFRLLRVLIGKIKEMME